MAKEKIALFFCAFESILWPAIIMTLLGQLPLALSHRTLRQGFNGEGIHGTYGSVKILIFAATNVPPRDDNGDNKIPTSDAFVRVSYASTKEVSGKLKTEKKRAHWRVRPARFLERIGDAVWEDHERTGVIPGVGAGTDCQWHDETERWFEIPVYHAHGKQHIAFELRDMDTMRSQFLGEGIVMLSELLTDENGAFNKREEKVFEKEIGLKVPDGKRCINICNFILAKVISSIVCTSYLL